LGVTAPLNNNAMLATVHAALPAITASTSQLGHRRPRGEPADDGGVGDQKQPGVAQHGFRQVEQRRQRAVAKDQQQRHRAGDDGIELKRAAQEKGWVDHGGSPWFVGGMECAG
jgi:hypothetical protein